MIIKHSVNSSQRKTSPRAEASLFFREDLPEYLEQTGAEHLNICSMRYSFVPKVQSTEILEFEYFGTLYLWIHDFNIYYYKYFGTLYL